MTNVFFQIFVFAKTKNKKWAILYLKKKWTKIPFFRAPAAQR